MPDRMERLEGVRRRLGLRQAELAAVLGATQGHYSKVVRRRTPPGPALAERIERWLLSHDAGVEAAETTDVSAKVISLVASIRDQCAELFLLIGSGQVPRPASSEDDASDR